MKEIQPIYYVKIHHSQTGQAFVTVSVSSYGSLITGEKGTEVETINNYGEGEADAFFLRPNLLKYFIFELLNSYLGQGSMTANDNGNPINLASCNSKNDCSSV